METKYESTIESLKKARDELKKSARLMEVMSGEKGKIYLVKAHEARMAAHTLSMWIEDITDQRDAELENELEMGA